MRIIPRLLLILLFAPSLMGGCVPGPSPTGTSLPPTPTYPSPTSTPVPILVTSAADSGPGTLRQALLDAEHGDTLTFDPRIFPSNAAVIINLSSGLPEITQGNITIDASNAGVILDGRNIAGVLSAGLSISSNNNIVRGLQIINFTGDGIYLGDGTQNNIIGGDRTIGTSPLGQGNLISNNGERGIVLSGAFNNTITGNYIGTDISGSTTWGNKLDGIHLRESGHNRVIGNLISGNFGPGIDLYLSKSSNNTISGNLIGAEANRVQPLGNQADGIAIHDGASQNIIGPDNIIAYNNGTGVMMASPDTLNNKITQNSIHDNDGEGIELRDVSNSGLPAAHIFYFDLNRGILAGIACARCTIEIFSESDDEGKTYEGMVIADETGNFDFIKGAPLTGPHLASTVTDISNNTSQFSEPSKGPSIVLQQGNDLPYTQLKTREPKELDDNHIGADIGDWPWAREGSSPSVYNGLLLSIRDLGIKWVRTNFWAPNPLNWQEVLRSPGVYSIPQDADDFISALDENGINIVLTLSAGSGLDGQEYGPNCWGEPGRGVLSSREPEWWFNAQEDRDRFIDYTRFMVQHFKGRVEYYEIWNEPSSGEYPADCRGGVIVNDYVTLVTQVAPIIRQIDPEAKIVMGAIGRFDERERQWMQQMLAPSVVSLVDAVSWHPFYGESPFLDSGENPQYPVRFYWRDYPSNVQNFRDQAVSSGFKGQYMVEEMVWRTQSDFVPTEAPIYSDITAAKIAARAIVMHLGMDFTMVSNQLLMPDEIKRLPRYYVIRNLSTVMAGATPTSLPVEIQSEAGNIKSYTFSLASGDLLVALWTDGIAVDEDPGINAIVTIKDFPASKVTGIDVLYSYTQPLISRVENGSLMIRDLLIKDYPLILYHNK